MDWKYKRFHQERAFPAPRDLVFEAARTFRAESLGWQITNTPDGFTAQGYSFSHGAIVNLHIQSAAGGTKVADAPVKADSGVIACNHPTIDILFDRKTVFA